MHAETPKSLKQKRREMRRRWLCLTLNTLDSRTRAGIHNGQRIRREKQENSPTAYSQ
jgi:hypothetical protein